MRHRAASPASRRGQDADNDEVILSVRSLVPDIGNTSAVNEVVQSGYQGVPDSRRRRRVETRGGATKIVERNIPRSRCRTIPWPISRRWTS